MLCSPKFPPREKGGENLPKTRPRDKKNVKKHRPYQERQVQRPGTWSVYSSFYGYSSRIEGENPTLVVWVLLFFRVLFPHIRVGWVASDTSETGNFGVF